MHKNEQSAHAQNIGNGGPSYEVKNPCFLIDWSCRLPFKEDSLREGEWVCHEYMNFVIQSWKVCGAWEEGLSGG